MIGYDSIAADKRALNDWAISLCWACIPCTQYNQYQYQNQYKYTISMTQDIISNFIRFPNLYS